MEFRDSDTLLCKSCPAKPHAPRRTALQNPSRVLRSSNAFVFIHFRTLLRNGDVPTPFPSITSALFPMQWGVGAPGKQPTSSLPYTLPSRLSDEDSRPERAQRVEGSLRHRFQVPYTLPFSVCSKSRLFTLFEKLPGWGVFLPKLGTIPTPSTTWFSMGGLCGG